MTLYHTEDKNPDMRNGHGQKLCFIDTAVHNIYHIVIQTTGPDDTVVCFFMEVKAYEADCWCNAIMGR